MITDTRRIGGGLLPEQEPLDPHAESVRKLHECRAPRILELPRLDEGDVAHRETGEPTELPLRDSGLVSSPGEARFECFHPAYVYTLAYGDTQACSYAGESAVVKSPGMSLLERMREVMRMRQWSEREWARRAGLKEEANVNQIMRALRKDADAEKIAGTAAVWVALARAAGVSLDWLLTGRGSPHSFTVDVHDDPRYPSRARVIGVAHLLGFSEAAISALLDHTPERDPGPDYWLRLLQAEQVKAISIADATAEKVRK